MTKAELTIIQYLENIETLLETILKCMEHKESVDPLITFTKANNVNNTFIEKKKKEIFQELDEKKVK